MKLTRRTAFHILCRCLTGALGQPMTTSDLPASPAEWEKVLRLSSAHLVTPQLRWALREQGLFSTLPADAAEYLEAVYTLNLEKNTQCEDQLAQFIKALNCIGVRPLLLKGAAVLVGGLYPTSGVALAGASAQAQQGATKAPAKRRSGIVMASAHDRDRGGTRCLGLLPAQHGLRPGDEQRKWLRLSSQRVMGVS